MIVVDEQAHSEKRYCCWSTHDDIITITTSMWGGDNVNGKFVDKIRIYITNCINILQLFTVYDIYIE